MITVKPKCSNPALANKIENLGLFGKIPEQIAVGELMASCKDSNKKVSEASLEILRNNLLMDPAGRVPEGVKKVILNFIA